MSPAPRQKEFFARPTPTPGTVFVNDRVCVQTEEEQRVVFVHGIIFSHYPIEDRTAEAYVMVTLFETGYADQNDIARCFGYSARTLRRYQERLKAGGLSALARPEGRPAGSPSGRKKNHERNQTILRLKAKGMSNRWIAGRLGLSEKTVRKSLRRLGWKSDPEPDLPFLPKADSQAKQAPVSASKLLETPLSAAEQPSDKMPQRQTGSTAKSFDTNPLDRSMDRLLAAIGLLDDALPVFAPTRSLPRAGVLLAIPALVASGLLSTAEKIYGSLGPAFYGLRTTLVAYVLLALLRIPRPETLKEYPPGELGRIVGLDRMPEMKTLRRKLSRLASLKGSYRLGREVARQRIAKRGKVLGFLYIDGHVRAYHGKHKVPKAYVTRMHLAAPATTDYWVNDQRGDPLFVVTADANAAMTRMLTPVIREVRELLGPRRHSTVVFDRGGWSPKLFQELLAMGFDILTYRKGRTRHIAEKRFTRHKAKLDGRPVEYLLHDQPVRFLKGKLRLRQVTRLTETGHQTPIVTSRWDLRAIVVAHRMFERWRQENFFKYLREEYLIDALADYQVEPDDPTRSIPNPARKAAVQEVYAARVHLRKLRESYGATAIDYIHGSTSTDPDFEIAEEKIRMEIDKATNHIKKLKARRDSLPARVTVADAQKGQEMVKLSTERKHLTNVLKMVAYQTESDLVELIRPHYSRVEDEGRTFIQMALQDTADIEPAEDQLRITLAPLSSPHRSRVLEALCETLNKTNTLFPGTRLQMRYVVAPSCLEAKSGQVIDNPCQEF
ncbi:MAG TPA: LuxR C-terminal-related transcriptional regulator [Candidatus Acidoferrum sp.]|nr:LuxR C-terminal-related transcriptional regulator [Candidatus Acidoferrum sp.]